MAKGTTFESDLLKLIFQATTVTALAQNAAGGIANLYVSLHTADPSAGNQNNSEAAYTGYNRVSVPRNSTGWTITTNSCVNNGAITFPACSGGSANVTYVAIGENTGGTAGEIYYAGALNAQLNISNGITPQFNSSNLQITES